MENVAGEGKLQQLLEQIQQETGKQKSAVPQGGQEVTPHAGCGSKLLSVADPTRPRLI